MGRKIDPYTVKLDLADAATDGRAIARHDNWVVFVEGGVPGDVADVEIYRKESKVLVGRVRKIHAPSAHRVQPACRHFGDCGGCKWQYMSYDAQLAYKENQILNIFRRIGKVEVGEALPILGCEAPYYYRNKLEFSFSTRAWIPKRDLNRPIQHDHRVLGYHAPRFFDKVLDIEECMLQTPVVNRIRNRIRDYAREQELSFYDIHAHTGLLRNIVFRTSVHTGEVMLILVVGENEPAQVDALFRVLEAEFPEITQFVWVFNPKWNSVYTDQPYQIWKGTPYYTEHLGPYQFRIRPVSFFQTNPRQAERLYQVVKDFLREALPAGQERFRLLYDLYAGTGSIGIFVSDLAEKIVGVEYVQDAVNDAWENVRVNQLDEARFSFYAGDMRHLLNERLEQAEGRPDIIVADPPRQGMDPQVVRELLRLRPPHILYVSCKPATQARDLYLMREWYEVVRIQPVDMFPHTAHVENVALLRRREAPLVLTVDREIPIEAEQDESELPVEIGLSHFEAGIARQVLRRQEGS
ncbi:MAG: 23S rRNA (uracil(1939)-C(5))-methyltransferase RlmD [Bacteroidia bacterium]|nr:23S rRNA (uracil(1939)-C(5))-methyltransferase RlmD [Bacteroidia bacterium]